MDIGDLATEKIPFEVQKAGENKAYQEKFSSQGLP